MKLRAPSGSAASFTTSFAASVAAVVIAASALVIALPALAYQYPLSTTDIRDAYFIGARNDELTAAFFSDYTRHLAAPESGPYVSDVTISTPYTQVARRSVGAVNYNSVEAVEEFDGKPMVFRVEVRFFFTDTYKPEPLAPVSGISLAEPAYPDFWNDFKVRLLQRKEIPPKSIRGAPVYPMWTADGDGPPPLPVGGRILLEFDPERIDTDDATVEVLTPDGQDIQVPFGLSRLR